MIVLDASALFHLAAGDGAGQAVARRIGEESLHAPHLIDLEVAQATRRLLLAGILSEERALALLRAVVDLDLRRYPHDALLEAIWTWRHNVTVYDGAYLALAMLLDCPLLTFDAPLAAAAGSSARIELLER